MSGKKITHDQRRWYWKIQVNYDLEKWLSANNYVNSILSSPPTGLPLLNPSGEGRNGRVTIFVIITKQHIMTLSVPVLFFKPHRFKAGVSLSQSWFLLPVISSHSKITKIRLRRDWRLLVFAVSCNGRVWNICSCAALIAFKNPRVSIFTYIWGGIAHTCLMILCARRSAEKWNKLNSHCTQLISES